MGGKECLSAIQYVCQCIGQSPKSAAHASFQDWQFDIGITNSGLSFFGGQKLTQRTTYAMYPALLVLSCSLTYEEASHGPIFNALTMHRQREGQAL